MMKITKSHLRKIIKEEIALHLSQNPDPLNEGIMDDTMRAFMVAAALAGTGIMGAAGVDMIAASKAKAEVAKILDAFPEGSPERAEAEAAVDKMMKCAPPGRGPEIARRYVSNTQGNFK